MKRGQAIVVWVLRWSSVIATSGSSHSADAFPNLQLHGKRATARHAGRRHGSRQAAPLLQGAVSGTTVDDDATSIVETMTSTTVLSSGKETTVWPQSGTISDGLHQQDDMRPVTKFKGRNGFRTAFLSLRRPMPRTNPIVRNVDRLSPATVQRLYVLTFMALSGAVEAFFIRYYQSFPNLLTGHTVKCFDALVDGRWTSGLHSLSIIVAYNVGVAIYKGIDIRTTVINQRMKNRPSMSQDEERKPQILSTAAWMTMFLFGLSDVIHYGMLESRYGPFAKWRMPFLAIGFGLINALSGEMFGSITNAITGHWTKGSMGLIGTLLTTKWHSPPNPSQSQRTSVPTSPPAWTLSAWAVATFVTSIVSTAALIRVLEAQNWLEWSQRVVLPPLGMTLGLVYGSLLMGYSTYLQRRRRR